jgi:hypothetical protein
MMEKWFLPDHQFVLAGKTVKRYGYDQQDLVDYSFNSLGFRSSEPANNPRLVVVGNSISFGIGLDMQHTFGAMLAQYTNRRLDNRSLGCFFHENHDQLHNIKLLAQQDQDSVFVIQINNLDRKRTGDLVVSNNSTAWCVERFLDFFDQTENILKNYPHKYIYWDNIDYCLPTTVLEKIVIRNRCHYDSSLSNNKNTFGVKSHSQIAKILRHAI